MKRRRLEQKIEESENMEDFSDDMLGDEDLEEDDGQDEDEYRGEKRSKPRKKRQPKDEMQVPQEEEGDLIKSDNEKEFE